MSDRELPKTNVEEQKEFENIAEVIEIARKLPYEHCVLAWENFLKRLCIDGEPTTPAKKFSYASDCLLNDIKNYRNYSKPINTPSVGLANNFTLEEIKDELIDFLKGVLRPSNSIYDTVSEFDDLKYIHFSFWKGEKASRELDIIREDYLDLLEEIIRLIVDNIDISIPEGKRLLINNLKSSRATIMQGIESGEYTRTHGGIFEAYRAANAGLKQALETYKAAIKAP